MNTATFMINYSNQHKPVQLLIKVYSLALDGWTTNTFVPVNRRLFAPNLYNHNINNPSKTINILLYFRAREASFVLTSNSLLPSRSVTCVAIAILCHVTTVAVSPWSMHITLPFDWSVWGMFPRLLHGHETLKYSSLSLQYCVVSVTQYVFYSSALLLCVIQLVLNLKEGEDFLMLQTEGGIFQCFPVPMFQGITTAHFAAKYLALRISMLPTKPSNYKRSKSHHVTGI